MGVHNLWQLLLPVGRRMSVETLERKILAVDVSIWLTQFIKAMRDDEGKVIKNAHLVGTFRRVVKLLFHKIKPVFVFDGGTPALKRRTVITRKQRRDHQELSIKKTAQRLLLAQLKKQHLSGKVVKGVKDAARGNKRKGSAVDEGEYAPGFHPGGQSSVEKPPSFGRKRRMTSGNRSGQRKREAVDEPGNPETARRMALASMGINLDEEEEQSRMEGQEPQPSGEVGGVTFEEEGKDGDEGEIEWEEAEDDPPSSSQPSGGRSGRFQAAHAFAQALPEGEGGGDFSSSEAEEDPGDILLEDDHVDISVLASLPPELQKDVVESAKRRQRLQSRQTFMPVAGDPLLYSQAQIASFLKSSALNHKVMSLKERLGDGESSIGERIASDATRNFIISRTRKEQKRNGGDDHGVEWESASNNEATVHGNCKGKLKRRGTSDDDDDDAEKERREALAAMGIVLDDEEAEEARLMEEMQAAQASGGPTKKRRLIIDEEEEDEGSTLAPEGSRDGEGLPQSGPMAELDEDVTEDIRGGGFIPEDDAAEPGPLQGGGFFPEEPEQQLAEAKEEPSAASYGVEETKRSGSPPRPALAETAMHRVTAYSCAGVASKAEPVFGRGAAEARVSREESVVAGAEKSRGSAGAAAAKRREWEARQQEDRDLSYALYLSELDARHEEKKRKEAVVIEVLDGGDDEEKPPAKGASRASRSTLGEEQRQAEADDGIVMTLDDHAPCGGGGAAAAMFDDFLAAVAAADAPSVLEKTPSGRLLTKPHGTHGTSLPRPTPQGEKRLVVSQDQALELAMATASSLTTWAGRAMRSAIRQHMDAAAVAPDPHSPPVAPIYPPSRSEIALDDDEDLDIDWQEADVHEPELQRKMEVLLRGNDSAAPITDTKRVESVAAGAESGPEAGGSTSVSGPSADEDGGDEVMVASSVLQDLSEAETDDSGAAVTTASPMATVVASQLQVDDHRGGDRSQRTDDMQTRAEDMTSATTSRDQARAPVIGSPAAALTADLKAISAAPPLAPSPSSSSSAPALHTPAQESSFALPGSRQSEQSTDKALMRSISGVTSVLEGDVEVVEVMEDEHGDMVVVGDDSLDAVDMSEFDDLEDEETLRKQLKKQMRDAESVTEEMREEVMELLDLFGVPYLVAPMEAEAQCAVLEAMGLVDGVVSDDSDCFLFGARAVYKNIFDERKYVEAYMADDIERELGLQRQDLVSLALLLGSDYTQGIRGVGIVNATEIVHAFPSRPGDPPEEGLKRFKGWLDGFDPVKDLASSSKGGKEEEKDPVEAFHTKHRSARHRWVVGDTFPDPGIFKAYLQPQVNHSHDTFDWALPDLEKIRLFAGKKLGWPVADTDGMLVPMLSRMQDRTTQTRLDSFYLPYQANIKFAKIRSQRLKKTVRQLTTHAEKQQDDEELPQTSSAGTGSKGKGKRERKKESRKRTTGTKKKGGRRKVRKLVEDTDSEEEEEVQTPIDVDVSDTEDVEAQGDDSCTGCGTTIAGAFMRKQM